MIGTPFSALAYYMSKNGLITTIFHESQELFKNDKWLIDQDGFKVCDPLYKTKQNRTFDKIEKFMNTSIGKWFISVNDKLNEKN